MILSNQSIPENIGYTLPLIEFGKSFLFTIRNRSLKDVYMQPKEFRNWNFYINDSKINNEIVGDNLSSSFRLSDHFSVLQADIMAIKKAVVEDKYKIC